MTLNNKTDPPSSVRPPPPRQSEAPLPHRRPGMLDHNPSAQHRIVLKSLHEGDKSALMDISEDEYLTLLDCALRDHLARQETSLDFLIELYHAIHRLVTARLQSAPDASRHLPMTLSPGRPALVNWLVHAGVRIYRSTASPEFASFAQRVRRFCNAFEMLPIRDTWIAHAATSSGLEFLDAPQNTGPFEREVTHPIPPAKATMTRLSTDTPRMLSCRFLGGSHIGQTSILLTCSSGNVLLDFGMADSGGMHWPRFRDLKEIDAVLVTHAHLDHSGGLLHLYRNGMSHPAWFASPQTHAISRIMFEDSLKVSSLEPFGRTSGERPGILDRINDLYRSFEWHDQFEVVPGVFVTAFPSGHVCGSASFLVETADQRLFYTGDYCTRALLSARALDWPSADILATVDHLIIEGTYAGRNGEVFDNRVANAELIETIAGMHDRGKRVLIPVMSLGRAQDVIACLADTPFKACVLGMASRITRCIGFDVPPNVYIHSGGSRGEFQDVLDFHDVVIASAGCLQGGASRGILDRDYADEFEVILTGYQFAMTPGRHLAETAKWPQIRFSAHASHDEFARTLGLFPNAKKYVIHFPGDAERLMRDWEVRVPEGGEEIELRIENLGLGVRGR